MKKWLVGAVSVLVVLMMGACAARAVEAPSAAPAATEAYQRDTAVEEAGERGPVPASEPGTSGTGGADYAAIERLVIRNATLDIVVMDTEATVSAVAALVEEYGGYIVESSTYQYEQGLQATVTFRVPAEKLDDALERIRKMATEVRHENITGQDVTEEYVDLRLLLKNAEATRDRLLAILEQAKTVKETLEVERELSRVREEIERIKGRLAFLERETAFSTIHIVFSLPAPSQVMRNRPPTPFAWLDALGVEHVLQLDR